MTTSIRRTLAAMAIATLTAGTLTACSQQDPAEFETAQPEQTQPPEEDDAADDGGEPADDSDGAILDGAIATTVLPIIDDGGDGTLTVGVHSVVVDGDIMELLLSFTPDLGGDPQNTYTMLQHFFSPVLNDRENLKQYREVWQSASGAAGPRLESGETRWFWAYYAAPQDDIDAIAVSVMAGAAEMPAIPIAAGTIPSPPGAGDQSPPEAPDGGVEEEELRGSVIHFTSDGSIERTGEDVVDDGEEKTISLAADLLFTQNSWELPAGASARIAELVSNIPDGARVQVVGHTDSQTPVDQDFDNQELSERRAEAVADVLRAERPDLELAVSGVGDADPAVTERADDPDTFAANRRVGITYEG